MVVRVRTPTINSVLELAVRGQVLRGMPSSLLSDFCFPVKADISSCDDVEHGRFCMCLWGAANAISQGAYEQCKMHPGSPCVPKHEGKGEG